MLHIITNNDQLDVLVDKLSKSLLLALDTEFYWRKTYYPELCLIQIATTHDIYIIDVLKKLKLDNLRVIFSDKNICKIMHSSQNDIKILKHYVKCSFCNIFDTQTANNFLNQNYQISLKNLLKELKIVELDKEQKCSDWRKRPLSDEQIQYAQNDVAFLLIAYKKIQGLLSKSVNINYVDYEMKRQEQAKYISRSQMIRKFNFQRKNLNKKSYENLINIMLWREDYAKEKNIIPKKIISDKEMINIAVTQPHSKKDFIETRLLSESKINKYSCGLIRLLNTQIKYPAISKIEKIKKYKLSKSFFEKIYLYLQKEAQLKNISITFLCSKKELKSFIVYYLSDLDNSNNLLMKNWRYDLFGKNVVNLFLKKYKSNYSDILNIIWNNPHDF